VYVFAFLFCPVFSVSGQSFYGLYIVKVPYLERFLALELRLSKRRIKGVLSLKRNNIEKSEKIVGYVLLALGFVVVMIPVCLGVSIIFVGGSAIPKILEAPALSFGDASISVGDETIRLSFSETGINEVILRTFPAVNMCLFFVVSVILVSAGCVLMGKGVLLLKEMNLRLVSESSLGGQIEVDEQGEREGNVENA
jgi:hypothetical protein